MTTNWITIYWFNQSLSANLMSSCLGFHGRTKIGKVNNLWKSTSLFRDHSFSSFIKCFEKQTFLTRWYAHVRKCSFFGKFGVLCFLQTPVLRFVLLPYYRRNESEFTKTRLVIGYTLLVATIKSKSFSSSFFSFLEGFCESTKWKIPPALIPTNHHIEHTFN